MNIKVKTTYPFVKLDNLSPFHILSVLVVNTRWRTLEVNDWNEKECMCVLSWKPVGWQTFFFFFYIELGSFDRFVIIKQDAMTSCHPLVNKQESHKPPKEQSEHWSGSLIDLFLSLLYFVFTHSYTPCTENEQMSQKTKTQNPMKIRFPLCQLTVQITQISHRQIY